MGLLRKTSISRISQLLGWRITVTEKYPKNVARSSNELALCSKELCSTWSFREFEMVVSSTDQQQARRHSAEIVKLLVPQGKNEAFRSRLSYRNLRLYECGGLIQISRTSTGGEHYFCYLFCCVFRLVRYSNLDPSWRENKLYNSFCNSCVRTFFQRMMFETQIINNNNNNNLIFILRKIHINMIKCALHESKLSTLISYPK